MIKIKHTCTWEENTHIANWISSTCQKYSFSLQLIFVNSFVIYHLLTFKSKFIVIGFTSVLCWIKSLLLWITYVAMVTGYQRIEFRFWATAPCTGTSSLDSCVWGSGYFGGFREMKGSIISFHFTLCTFLFKIITTELAVTSRKHLLWNNFIAICLTWWMMRDTILFLSLKKIITLLLIIINYWFTAMHGLYRTFWGQLFAWTS